VAAQGEPRDAGGIPVATVDQEAGVRLVLDHLIGQGHKRILHVAGPRDWNDAQSRLRAFKAGLRAAGLLWSPPLYGDWTSDSGYAIGRALVQEGSGGNGTSGDGGGEGTGGRKPRLPFTAVFAANDQMALGVIHAFREAGLDVPRDVSIVGFDDIPESAHFWPPLTTVRQDFGDLGVRCVTMLLDLIQGTGVQGAGTGTSNRAGAVHDGPPAAVAPVVQPQLIIRGSVAAVKPAE
jgi:DNA-binding LacI/PurR family transcriptional regulator